ncbi:hypothetical protein MTO96_016179 [Rhipicephalus appendiculatus]
MCETMLLDHAGFLEVLLRWWGHCHTGFTHLMARNCGDMWTRCGAAMWTPSLLSSHRLATPPGRKTLALTQINGLSQFFSPCQATSLLK